MATAFHIRYLLIQFYAFNYVTNNIRHKPKYFRSNNYIDYTMILERQKFSSSRAYCMPAAKSRVTTAVHELKRTIISLSLYHAVV